MIVSTLQQESQQKKNRPKNQTSRWNILTCCDSLQKARRGSKLAFEGRGISRENRRGSTDDRMRCRCAFRNYKRPIARAGHGKYIRTFAMASSSSKWWKSPDDADLDYGFDSDDLDARFTGPNHRNPRPPAPREAHEQAREQQKEQPSERGVFGNMSSWFQRQAGAPNSQLATTAVLSGAAVAGAIFGYQAYRRKEAVYDLKASIPELDDRHHAEKVSSTEKLLHKTGIGC